MISNRKLEGWIQFKFARLPYICLKQYICKSVYPLDIVGRGSETLLYVGFYNSLMINKGI